MIASRQTRRNVNCFRAKTENKTKSRHANASEAKVMGHKPVLLFKKH